MRMSVTIVRLRDRGNRENLPNLGGMFAKYPADARKAIHLAVSRRFDGVGFDGLEGIGAHNIVFKVESVAAS
jgi:hypothetical protein